MSRFEGWDGGYAMHGCHNLGRWGDVPEAGAARADVASW